MADIGAQLKNQNTIWTFTGIDAHRKLAL